MQTIKLGLSGDIASFSEQASLLYAKKANLPVTLIHLIDMEGVLAALENGDIDLGIFPVFNFRGGLVKMAFEAMGKHLFTFVDEIWLDVQQCLMTLPDTEKNAIRSIVSHPQGLAQCQDFLSHTFPNAEQIEWIDTAKAAKDLAKHKLDKNTAVIAPARAAEHYGLKIVAEAIQDHKPNHTIFIVTKHHDLTEE